MSERTSFNATKRIHIGFHENSAFTPMKSTKPEPTVGKQLESKKDAYAYIKTLFSTYRVLPEIKNK